MVSERNLKTLISKKEKKMWKKGEIVWVSLNLSDNWIPGRILNRSITYGLFVSFFDLMQPRYVPELCLRSFERDFEALISDSWKIHRFVNRALRSHFWNISYELWCPCQRPIDSPYVDRELSLPCLPLDSDSSLCFVRDLAVSPRVSLRRLAEINSSCARILSFRRYNVDFQRSESVYKEIIESAKLLDGSEETDWCLDPSNKIGFVDMVTMFTETMDTDVDDSRDLSLGDLFSKDVLCCSSPCSEQPVDKTVQRCTWSTKNHLTSSDSSFIKACVTMAPAADHEDVSHALESRERCQVSPSIAVSEALLDVVTETHDDVTCSDDIMVTSAEKLSPMFDASKDDAFMAKHVSFVVAEACKNLACSVKETNVSPRNMLDSSMVSAKNLDVEPSDMNTFNGTRKICSEHVLESHIVETSKVSLCNTGSSDKAMSSDDVGPDLEPATTVENQTQAVDNERSIGVKRKASSVNSKRKKKARQQCTSTNKQPNLHLMKDMRLADPKCLRMRFLSRHGNLPSKSELLKRFSVFGKIDSSRTDVNTAQSSAKVVFLQSIDAVTAFQFARTKKFTLGRSKVIYRLDPFEQDNEVKQVAVSHKPQQYTPSPKSCLKEHGSVDKDGSKSVYKEIREGAKLLDDSEESDQFLDSSNCIDLASLFPEIADELRLRDLFLKDIPCCSSPCSEQPVDKIVQSCTWRKRNPLTSSSSSIIKACLSVALTADHEDAGHTLESRERCEVSPSTAVSEAPLDVVTETHDDTTGLNGRTVTSAKQTPPLLDVSEEEAFMGESVSFVVTEACKNLACSVKETNVSPTKMLDSSMVSAKTLDVEPSDKNTFRVTLESCSDHVLESHIVETSKVSLHNTGSSDKAMSSDDIDVAPAKQLRDLEPATTNDLEPATTNQTQAVDNNVRSIGVKRKASQDKAGNSKRKKKAKQQSSSNDKQQNLHLMKDTRLADPKCLRMKFLSRHGNHPSKSELLKRFSVFGKIDASRTDVNIGESSAKVVFLQSIDAVTAFQFARTKKFTLGRSKVRYWLDPFEQDNEVKQVPVSQNLQEHTPSPRSCLKEHGSVDKEERRRNLKVKFQMETN